MKTKEEKSSDKEGGKDSRDANTCMALGAGVGVLGAASAALTGAICPLCIFVAPGLIGIGAFRRWKITKTLNNAADAVKDASQLKTDL